MSNEKNENSNQGNGGQGGNPHQEVTIHIDKQMFKSPNPTTGAALYILGKVNTSEYDLYREVHGKGDDEFIQNNANPVHLKNGDHFNLVQKNLNPGIQ